MARLSDSERSRLPDRAFAYIDSKGRRLLPIHDESHVRNALARFNQVRFESDAARERARHRLLRAAKRHGIVPIGFFASQLRSETAKVRSRPSPASLPSGLVTLLFSDIEGSTPLLQDLGDQYAEVLERVVSTLRRSVTRHGGHEVEVRADEYFAVFERPAAALKAGIAAQRSLERARWPGNQVRVRIGIHTGRVKLTGAGYMGLTVNTAARVCSAAHGGQIVVTDDTRSALGEDAPAGVRLTELGSHRLAGLAGSHPLFQVEAKGLATGFPPLRTSTA